MYEGGGVSGLSLTLNHTSRQSTDTYSPSGVVGLNWVLDLDSKLLLATDGTTTTGPSAVYIQRPNGQTLTYTRSGSNYVPDADVAHKLLRQADANGGTTGWRLIDATAQTTETYDAGGKLLSLTDRNGLTRSLGYDTNNRVTSLTDAQGRQLTLGYDGSNRINAVTQPDTGIIHLAYDGSGNLSTVTWPDGKVRSYQYESTGFPHNLTGITDENGVRYATYGYDAQGRATSETHAGGADATTLSFGTNSTTVTDARSTARTYTFQTILGVTKSLGSNQPGGSGCAASSSALSYDANGNLASRTDFNGYKTTYTYDLSRNLETQRKEGLNGDGSARAESRTVSTQWHSYWRLPVKVAEPLKLTTWVYNGDTYGGSTVTCAPASATVPSITGGTQPIGVLCQKIEQATTDANGAAGLSPTVTGTPRTWAWTYDQYGQVLTANGPRTDVVDVTTATYYSATDPDLGKRGNLATVTNALGHLTQITAYDLNGRPLTLIDPNGLTTTLTYDPRGRLKSKNVGGETIGYDYDAVGQLTKLTLPDGAFLSYTYDGAHRLTQLTDSLGNQIVYTLDAMGNRTQEDVKDPLGTLSRTRQRAYDALNRLYQDIGATGQTTTYTYDANGNRTGATDPLSHSTTQAYDALNRLIRITDPNSGIAQLAYNGQDQITQVTDPRNLVTGYTLDGLGNLTQQTSPDTGTTQRTLDAAGNLLTQTDAKGQVTTTTHDAGNRLTLASYSDGRQARYTWDQGSNQRGRLTQIDELNGATVTASRQFQYDLWGRIVQETRTETSPALTLTTAYRYSQGDLASMTYPSGKRIDYTRDSLGRIRQIKLTNAGQITTVADQITYHPFGGLKSYVNGAGQTLTRSQDSDGRTSAYTLGSSAWQIGYDNASRLSYQTDSSNAANTVTYGYDVLDRLNSAVLPSTTLGYGYDANGNRTSQTVGAASYTDTIDTTSNRLTALNTVPAKSYSHDANGSRTGDGSQTFNYDARGRLIQSTGALGTTTYQVDAEGKRVGKTNSSEDVRYVYDRAGHLIAETDAAGNAKVEYLWLGDTPIAVLQ